MNSSRADKQSSGKTEKIIIGGLLMAVVFAALAHGAVEPWSVFVFETILLALVLLWAVLAITRGRLTAVVPKAALPIAALMAIGMIQSIVIVDKSGNWSSLSKDIEATRSTVTVLAFLLLAFVISATFLVSRRRLNGAAHFLIVYGMAMALFALIQHFTWNGKFYWIRPNTVSISPFGPFVNHNHFAGYMELLIGVPLGLIVTRAVPSEKRLLFGFAAAVMGAATVASLSRGGMISLAAEVVFLAVMGWRVSKARRARQRSEFPTAQRRSRAASSRARAFLSKAAIPLVLAAILGISALWVGPDRVISRIVQGQQGETFYSSRGWVWRDALAMIKANPILGVGLGAFGTAFPVYSRSNGAIRVPQAHNDYLQIMADCGIVGGAIALWFLVLVFRAISRGLRSDDPLLSGLALGCGTGIFGILVHSLFDFNLQLPSNALMFLLMVAVSSNVAAAVSRMKGSQALEGKAVSQAVEERNALSV